MSEMRIILILAFVLYSFGVEAQNLTKLEADSIDSQLDKRYQIYIAPGFNANQFVETGSSFFYAYFGMIYENNIDFSISYSLILDEFKKQIIFPGDHKYNQTNFGLDLQYSFLVKKIRPHIGIGYRLAQASWEPLSDSNDTFTDNINIYQANIGAKWLLSKIINLQANFGYNFADNVELTGLTNEDYNGFKLDLILKIRILDL